MKTVLKVLGVVAALLLATLLVAVVVYFPGHNLRTVEAGVFYGSRQMTGKALHRYFDKYGVKTLINLRGENPGADWYDPEAEACRAAGVRLENFSWSKNKIPDPESLARFINVIETGTPPFLAHCQGGTHRTGMAAAVYQLLKGKDTATARKQFGPMFLNAPIGQLVDLYEGSNMPFKQWALEVYPGKYAELREKPASGEGAAVSAPASALPAPAAG